MTGKPGHRLEDPLEVGLLHRQQPLERRTPLVLVPRQDHLAHDRQPLVGHEHVLGAAEPDALGAELARLRGVLGSVGVRAHPQAAEVVGPAEDRPEVLVDRGRHERDGADDHAAVPAVDREEIALAQLVTVDRDRPHGVVDREPLAPGDARLPHPARDNGRVRGHPPVRGQHSARLDEAVDVVGRRLPADEDHVLAGPAALLRGVCVEHDCARGRAGRRVEPARDDLDLGRRVDHRVQELVELGRVDAGDGLVAGDEGLLDHLRGHAQRGARRAFAGARLEQEEFALLDGELDVLQLAVVRLEPVERLDKLLEHLGHEPRHPLDRLRRSDPRDDVLALRVLQELAVQPALARRRVAREADTSARALAAVPEHHLHDVDRGPEIVRDLVRLPVDLRARRVPGVEDRAVRALQLRRGVLRERRPGLGLVDLGERGDELAEVVGGEVDVLRDSALGLQVRERLLEAVPVDARDHLPVHLHEAAVGVEREARVAGRLRESLDRDVVQAEIEDRVHHPGHRDRGAGAHGHEERVVRVAEALAGSLLERRDVLVDLAVQTVGDLAAAGHVGAARVGRDGEACRDRDPELRHLDEPDPLSAEKLAIPSRVLVEVVDVAH